MLFISGLSGAGKSTVLHALEDAGYFCTDNLPLEMLRDWAEHMQTRQQPAAVCLDMRSGFTARAIKAVIEDELISPDWQLLFVEASDAVLQRRFSTVRRRHPYLDHEGLMASIRLERESLLPIRAMADFILDSSELTPYQLAERVDQFLRGSKPFEVACQVISFSYKYGLPEQADSVFDMRFLPNPHYIGEMAQMTGRDNAVIAYLRSHDEVLQTEQHLQRWLHFIWPQLRKERKAYFTIAFGCSGGRHRSVYMAEQTARWLTQKGLAQPTVLHRELARLETASEEAQP